MPARLGFGKIALCVSVLVHTGVAVVAARHGYHALASSALQPLIAAPELVPSEPELGPPHNPEAPPHAEARAVPREAGVHTGALAVALPTASRDAEPAPAPSVVAAPEPSTPRFTMLVAATTAPAAGTTSASTHAASVGSFSEAPLAESAVGSRATLRAGTPPAYTAQALAAGVESDVPLEIVIDEAGGVASARVLTPVGYGLDEAALHAVRGYRFAPARRAGRAVAVRMRWVMRFQLQ